MHRCVLEAGRRLFSNFDVQENQLFDVSKLDRGWIGILSANIEGTKTAVENTWITIRLNCIVLNVILVDGRRNGSIAILRN